MSEIKDRASFTPICDFVEKYRMSDPLRAHMPGHKGYGFLGYEDRDITEIDGADSLFEADGIIKESESIASEIFGTAETFYSCEGSSLSIKAMIYLAYLASDKGKSKGNLAESTAESTTESTTESPKEKPCIFASRNAHKAFICACALLDIDVHWLYSDESQSSHLKCEISKDQLDAELSDAKVKPFALYITSPDYLGNLADISGLAEVCKKHGVFLLVDNAHGAYLKFLEKSLHPMDLGAHMCCDSAHKTLPVLTGGSYLHISKNAPENLLSKMDFAMDALALFGSTSPSYLILQSLDKANEYMALSMKKELAFTLHLMEKLKSDLLSYGYELCGNEPMKLTISAKKYGYFGYELAKILRENNIFCEFYDSDYLVLMLSPQNPQKDFEILKDTFSKINRKPEIKILPPKAIKCEKVLSPKDAISMDSEILPVELCNQRILACTSVSCPPAVPIAVMGERLSCDAIEAFKYYGIKECKVVKE